jgi:hypothetical protein
MSISRIATPPASLLPACRQAFKFFDFSGLKDNPDPAFQLVKPINHDWQ